MSRVDSVFFLGLSLPVSQMGSGTLPWLAAHWPGRDDCSRTKEAVGGEGGKMKRGAWLGT